TEEEEDGFKTPTSSDCKIPIPTECPPAPRKRRRPGIRNSKPLSLPPSNVRCRLRFEVEAAEVESIF
ncbi:hypothetical protein M569_02107, partial [Genlisea aurea]